MSGSLPKAKRIGGANKTVVWMLAGVAVVLVGALAYLLVSSPLFSKEARTDADRDYQLLVEGAKKNPKDPAIQMTLAETEFRLGKKDDGLERAAKAVKLAEEQAGYRTRYATLLVQVDELEKAKMLLVEEIDIAGEKDPEPHFLLAQVLSELGDDEGAIKTMKSGLALNPNAADMRIAYGRILENAKRKDEAIAQYQLALKFLPGDKTAIDALGRLGVKVEESPAPDAGHGAIATPTGDAQ